MSPDACGDTGRKNQGACEPEAPVGGSLHQANLSQILTLSFFIISLAIEEQLIVLAVPKGAEGLTGIWSAPWNSIVSRSSMERTLVAVELARTIVSRSGPSSGF